MLRIHPFGTTRRIARYLKEQGLGQKWWLILAMTLVLLLFIFICVAGIIVAVTS